MLTAKERMLAVMTDGLSEGYPVVIPYADLFLRDHWEDITDKLWWMKNCWDVSPRLEVEMSFQKKVGIDWVEAHICPPRYWRETHRVKVLGCRFFLVDASGNIVIEIFRPPLGGFVHKWPSLREPIVRTFEDVDTQIGTMKAEELIDSGRLDYIEAVIDECGSERFVVCSVGSPFWEIYPYFGVRRTLLNLFKNPELISYLLEKLLARDLEYLRAYAAVGVDGVWVEECLTSADIISRSLYERFVLPYVKRQISEIRRLGMKSIYYPCGDVRDRLKLMIEMRPDCISLEESKKNFQIDIDRVDKIVAGRACIFGNLDAVWLLRSGTHSDLKKEITRQIDVGRNYGKFVMSLGSPVTPETPVCRVREYVKIARQIADA